MIAKRDREDRVLRLLAGGMSERAVAQVIGASRSTVRDDREAALKRRSDANAAEEREMLAEGLKEAHRFCRRAMRKGNLRGAELTIAAIMEYARLKGLIVQPMKSDGVSVGVNILQVSPEVASGLGLEQPVPHLSAPSSEFPPESGTQH